MHQRSCRAIRDMQLEDLDILEEELLQNSNQDTNDGVWNAWDQNQCTFEDCFVKCGVQLPRSSLQWSIANDFFKAAFSNAPLAEKALDHVIRRMNNTI